jgi:hypothetical protein
MKNVEMTVQGNILAIKVDLSREYGPSVPSSSGKTLIIASTEGNVSAPGREEAKVGLNIYKKRQGSTLAMRGRLQVCVGTSA